MRLYFFNSAVIANSKLDYFSYDDCLLQGKIENNSHANFMDDVKIMVNDVSGKV